jgi:hypothetical protein
VLPLLSQVREVFFVCESASIFFSFLGSELVDRSTSCFAVDFFTFSEHVTALAALSFERIFLKIVFLIAGVLQK